MLTLSGSLLVFLALEARDMRKSFDSLHALVVSKLGEDPRCGAVFAFTIRTRNISDSSGSWVFSPRTGISVC